MHVHDRTRVAGFWIGVCRQVVFTGFCERMKASSQQMHMEADDATSYGETAPKAMANVLMRFAETTGFAQYHTSIP